MAGAARRKSTSPLNKNEVSEARLEARLTGLAVPEAVTMSMPATQVNSMIISVPAPGPKKPS